MLNRETLHRIYIFLAMIIIAICGCLSMAGADTDQSTSLTKYTNLAAFLFLLPGVVIYIHFLHTKANIAKPIKWLTWLLLWAAITSLLHSSFDLNSLHRITLTSLFPLISMITMYSYTAKYGLNKAICWGAILMQLILLFQYMLIYEIANSVNEAHLMTAYYPMYILPLVLLCPSKTVRYISILLVVIIIFSSIKRGGFIALIIGLIFYIFSLRQISNQGRIRSFFYTLLSLGILVALFYYIATSEYGGVIERLMNIRSDEGSGRINVWITTWNMIQQSDMLSFLIGHGNNAVIYDSPLYLSAHNDFLEAWYDYGLFGFILYVTSLASVVHAARHFIKKKSLMAPSLAMIIGIVLVLTSIAHVIIYYFMVLFCMTLGLLLGHGHYEERLNENSQER